MAELVGAMMIVVVFAGWFVYAWRMIGIRVTAVVYLISLMLFGWLFMAAWLINGGPG